MQRPISKEVYFCDDCTGMGQLAGHSVEDCEVGIIYHKQDDGQRGQALGIAITDAVERFGVDTTGRARHFGGVFLCEAEGPVDLNAQPRALHARAMGNVAVCKGSCGTPCQAFTPAAVKELISYQNVE